jgi:hypothetical protein
MHPVELVITDNLKRSRLTVFFRLLLAIPHRVVLFFWTLATGTPPRSPHEYLSHYIVYVTRVYAYLWLAANPYPEFSGRPTFPYPFPIDLRMPERTRQSRLVTLFRIVLALPAFLFVGALGVGIGIPMGGRNGRYGLASDGAFVVVLAVLLWFVALALGRAPRGLRDAIAYALGYGAQFWAYLLMITDRYPNSDPTAMLAGIERPPRHAVRLVGESYGLRRSRLTVFFRLLLTVPHLVWLVLWGVTAVLASIATWLVTLVRGRPPAPLHRYLSRYVRYQFHVGAFLYLAANPFPGFVGEAGRYPLDVELPVPGRQNRWKTGFRGILALPAWIVASAAGGPLFVAVLSWFHGLVLGRSPMGLRNLSAYVLRYNAQLYAYLLFVTDAYPNASPLEGADPVDEQVLLEAA